MLFGAFQGSFRILFFSIIYDYDHDGATEILDLKFSAVLPVLIGPLIFPPYASKETVYF